MRSRGVRLCIVGSEVLNGFILDSNSRFFASELYRLGIPLNEVRVLPDEPEIILQTWQDYAATGDLIINSGGLGPTDDDLTIDLLCKFLGVEAVYDSYAERKLRVFFKKRKGQIENDKEKTIERALRQVRIPAGEEALANKVGLAPGVWVKSIPLVALPGFPLEIKSIWPQVLQKIEGLNFATEPTVEVPIWGIGESTLFSELALGPEIEVGVHALPLGSRLFLRSKEPKNLEQAEKDVRQKYSANVVENPLAAFFDFMVENNQTISTAESCTGGLLAKLFTDIPGSSKVYLGSIVSYDNQIKEKLLAVSADTLVQYGAVSSQSAAEMVKNGQQNMNSDYCIATTGIAGPSGGTEEKPVGTVYIGIAGPGEAWVGRFNFPLGRERFRNAVCYTAMLSLYQRFIHCTDAEAWQNTQLGSQFEKV